MATLQPSGPIFNTPIYRGTHTEHDPETNEIHHHHFHDVFVPVQSNSDNAEKKKPGLLRKLAIGISTAAAGIAGLSVGKPAWFKTILAKVEEVAPTSLSNAFKEDGFIGKAFESLKKPFQEGGIFSDVTGFIKKFFTQESETTEKATTETATSV